VSGYEGHFDFAEIGKYVYRFTEHRKAF
jgi:hypothetical protein